MAMLLALATWNVVDASSYQLEDDDDFYQVSTPQVRVRVVRSVRCGAVLSM